MIASESAPSRRPRTVATVTSLDALVGAHPAALGDIYRSGAPCDPRALARGGRHTRGLLLAIERLGAAHLATRPIVAALARALPWRGKAFESGGTGGANVVLGRELLRFRSELGRSVLDGEPTLVLRYDELGNPWPLSRLVDELRTVGEGVHVGPAFWQLPSGKLELLFWWGLGS